jgi:hypothetical protein
VEEFMSFSNSNSTKAPNIEIDELEQIETSLAKNIQKSEESISQATGEAVDKQAIKKTAEKEAKKLIYSKEVISTVLKIEEKIKYKPFIGIKVIIDEETSSFEITGFLDNSRAKKWADDNNISKGTVFAFKKNIANFEAYIAEKIRSGTLGMEDLDIDRSKIITNTTAGTEVVESEKDKKTILENFVKIQPRYYDVDCKSNPSPTEVQRTLLKAVKKVKTEITDDASKQNLANLSKATEEINGGAKKSTVAIGD